MSTQKGTLGPSGQIKADHVPGPHRPARVYAIRTPLGRMWMTGDKGESRLLSADQLTSSLQIVHRSADGTVKDVIETGSGLVTNAGVDAMANDFSWATATLKAMNFHAIGTGATAAAASDIVLQTPTVAASLTGSTNGYMTGTQSLVQPNILKTVATFTANAGISATEWGLFTGNALAISIVASGTTYTATGAAFSAVTLPPVQSLIVNLAAAANTPTTTAMGIVTASTTTSATVPAWNTLANAAASTPTNATASQVVPTMLDHKVYGVITLVATDTLQLSYQITLAAGG